MVPNCEAQRVLSGRRRRGRLRTLAFGSWNVRTLVNNDGPVETAKRRVNFENLNFVPVVEDRKIDLVIRELSRFDVEVAGLQETKWFGRDSFNIGDSIVLASGRPRT